MSSSLVPLTVYKGAGHEHIPFNAGNPHITADFHSIRTKTEAPAYVTSGFYKVEAGPTLSAHYAFEEAKYVLSGQIDVYVSHVIMISSHQRLSVADIVY
jgi:hypothetical protein